MRCDRHLLIYLFGCLFLALIGLLLLQSSGYAQAPPLIISDSSRDHLLSLKDIDGDGRFLSPGESQIALTDLSGTNLSIPNALLYRPDDLLLLDGGSLDQLISLRDLDNDERWLTPGEITLLYDGGGSVPDWVYPTAIGRDPTSNGGIETLYIADRSTTRRRILQLRDLDHDGIFNSGEVQVWWSVDTSPGVDPEFLPTDLIPIGESELLVIDGPRAIIHRARDLNGNGIIDTFSEWTPWFDSAQEFGIDRISDVQCDLRGRFWLADDLSGKILLLEDLDNNDSISGDVEILLFTNSPSPRSIYPHPDEGIYIGDSEGDTLWYCRDIDGNQTALGTDECIEMLPNSFSDLSTPSSISAPQGWQSLYLESTDPSPFSRDGGLIEIQGDGWSPGDLITLNIAGTEISGSSVFPQRIVADLPPLLEGVHDLWIQAGSRHGYFPDEIFVVPTFIRGDVNRDHQLQLADPIRLLQWLFIPGVPPLPCLDAADVNDDEMLQLIDALWLLEYLFASGPMPAPPFPQTGPDPIQEDQGCLH